MTTTRNYLTIRNLMNTVPGKQGVLVKDYVSGSILEQPDANGFVEFIRNNCCVGFDGDYEVYGVGTQDGLLVISICPREGIHYIEVPVYSEYADKDGNHEIISYRRENI